MYKISIIIFMTYLTLNTCSKAQVDPSEIDNLVCFWDFNEDPGKDRISNSDYPYQLKEGNGKIARQEEGIFGNHSAVIEEGQWFYIPRAECPELNISGKDAKITVVAWIKRERKSYNQCEAIAGMWDETNLKRQYCLFLNLGIWDSKDQVCGHISGTGGPTEGFKYCMDAAIGNTIVPYGEWICVGITYNGEEATAYLNGQLDYREKLNPYKYDLGIFDPGESGGDFTVGAVDRFNEMGNCFVGQIGGLAVYNRALNEKEMAYLANNIKK